MNGFVLWFTGLSGAGKSTLAAQVGARLTAIGKHVEVLDGDGVRAHLSKGLAFDRPSRDENVMRIAFVASLLARAGAVAITAAISPYAETRARARALSEHFIEVFVECPIHVLTQRDPKGLYEKALSGEIANFTGISDPYEAPVAAEIKVDTSVMSEGEAVEHILARLAELGQLMEPGGRLPPPLGLPGLAARPASPPSVEWRLSEGQLALFELAAHGFLRPVCATMSAKDLLKVEREGRLESGLAFPVMVALTRSADGIGEAASGTTVRLVGGTGDAVLFALGHTETLPDRLLGKLGDADATTLLVGDLFPSHQLPYATTSVGGSMGETSLDSVRREVAGALGAASTPRVVGALWGSPSESGARAAEACLDAADVLIGLSLDGDAAHWGATLTGRRRGRFVPVALPAFQRLRASGEHPREVLATLGARILRNLGATHMLSHQEFACPDERSSLELIEIG